MQDDRGVFTTRSAERSSHSSLRPRSTLPAQPLATSAAADATKSTWKTSETSFLSPLVSRAPVGAANLIEASPMGPFKMSCVQYERTASMRSELGFHRVFWGFLGFHRVSSGFTANRRQTLMAADGEDVLWKADDTEGPVIGRTTCCGCAVTWQARILLS